MGRYGLMPQHTGYMALGADAQGGPDGPQWDGVALTLFFDARELQFVTQRR